MKLFISNFSKTILKKLEKCHISEAEKSFELSYLEAEFAPSESTLTAPHFEAGNFEDCEVFEIITKIVISRKLKAFETPDLETKLRP